MAKKRNPTSPAKRRRYPLEFVKANGFLDDDFNPIPGICCVCGCEDDNACEEGCEWVNAGHTLCSSCLVKIGRIPARMMSHYCGSKS